MHLISSLRSSGRPAAAAAECREEGRSRGRSRDCRRQTAADRFVGWLVGFGFWRGLCIVPAALYRRAARVFLGAALAPVGLCGVRCGLYAVPPGLEWLGWAGDDAVMAGILFRGREGRHGMGCVCPRLGSRKSERNGVIHLIILIMHRNY